MGSYSWSNEKEEEEEREQEEKAHETVNGNFSISYNITLIRYLKDNPICNCN